MSFDFLRMNAKISQRVRHIIIMTMHEVKYSCSFVQTFHHIVDTDGGSLGTHNQYA